MVTPSVKLGGEATKLFLFKKTANKHVRDFLNCLAALSGKSLLINNMLEFDLTISSVSIATFVAYLVGLIPLLPGSLGSFEGSMALMFTRFGLTTAEAFSLTMISRTVTFWFPLLVSAIVTCFFVVRKQSITPVQPITNRQRSL